jgi:hypothetical protein
MIILAIATIIDPNLRILKVKESHHLLPVRIEENSRAKESINAEDA